MKIFFNLLASLTLSIIVFFSSSSIWAQHTLDEVRVYDEYDTWVTGINNQGFICGYYFDPTINAERGFVLTPNGRFRFFYAATGYTHSRVMSLNNKDSFTVLIRMSNSTGLSDSSVIYKSYYRPLGDSFTTKEWVQNISPSNPAPTSINKKEVMAGWYSQSSGAVTQPRFFWLYFDDPNNMPANYTSQYYATRSTIGTSPQPTFAGGLNDSNSLAGYFYNLNTTSYTSFIFDIPSKTFTNFNNLSDVMIQGMNNESFVVGKRKLGANIRPFMGTYSGSTLLNIPIPIFSGVSTTSEFTDVNDKEEIVGNYTHPVSGKSVGFIYRRNRDSYYLPGFEFAKNKWGIVNYDDYQNPPQFNYFWTPLYFSRWDYNTGYDYYANLNEGYLFSNTSAYRFESFHRGSSPSWPAFASEFDKYHFNDLVSQSVNDKNIYLNHIRPLLVERYLDYFSNENTTEQENGKNYLFFPFHGVCYGFAYSALQRVYEPGKYQQWFGVNPNPDAINFDKSDTSELFTIERMHLKQLDNSIYQVYYAPESPGVEDPFHMTTWKGVFRLKNAMATTMELSNPRGMSFDYANGSNPAPEDYGGHIVLPYKIKTPTSIPFDYPQQKFDTLYFYDANNANPLDSGQYFLINPTLGVLNFSDSGYTCNSYPHVKKLSFNSPGIRDEYEDYGLPQFPSRPTGISADDTLYTLSTGNNLEYTAFDNDLNSISITNQTFANNSTKAFPKYHITSQPEIPSILFVNTSTSISLQAKSYSMPFMRLAIANNSYVMTMSRFSAESNEKDNFKFSNRQMNYGNPDNTTKHLTLHFIQHDEALEHSVNFMLTSFPVKTNDSVETSNPSGYLYKIKRIASSLKTYHVKVLVYDEGEHRVVETDVPIEGNTTHVIDPFFHGPNGNQVVIFVDNGNNGINEDTLFLDPVAIEPIYNDGITIKTYPNPSSSVIFIEATGLLNNKIEADFIDIKGRKVLQNKLSLHQGKGKLDISALSSGTYFLSIHHQGKLIYKDKIVKID